LASSNTGTGTTYFWNWGDGTTSTGKEATHVYKKSGTYEVCVKIYSPTKKCFVYICRKIEIVVSTSTSTKSCNWAGKGVSLGVSNKCNVYTFEGKNLNLNGTNCIKYGITVNGKTYYNRVATHTFTQKGTYNVCIKYYDSCNKCDTTICKSITVDCLPCAAVAKFQVDSVSATGKMYVKNLSTGANAYSWNFGDSSANSYDKTPGHKFATSGTYVVCLTAYDTFNNCSNVYCYTVKVLKTRSKTSVQGIQGSAYPNPADQGFYLDLSGDAQYTVYNNNGQIVSTGKGNKVTYVETASWSEGNYRVVLTNANGTQTINTVIAH
jgi:PKD repeat protein